MEESMLLNKTNFDFSLLDSFYRHDLLLHSFFQTGLNLLFLFCRHPDYSIFFTNGTSPFSMTNSVVIPNSPLFIVTRLVQSKRYY